MRDGKTEYGFSLIELLVVVGIISLAAGAAFVEYKRDKSKDHLVAAAGQVASLIRGAAAAGMALGRNVVVQLDPSGTDQVLIWVDNDYERDYDAGTETLFGQYSIPATWTDVKFEYVKPTTPAKLEFLHRGDSRYNLAGTGGTAPTYSNFVMMIMSTGPTTPSTSDNYAWFTFFI